MKSNLNTMLLGCTMAVLAWNAKTTFEMSREVSSMLANIKSVERRSEIAERDSAEFRLRVTQCEIELAKIKRTN